MVASLTCREFRRRVSRDDSFTREVSNNPGTSARSNQHYIFSKSFPSRPWAQFPPLRPLKYASHAASARTGWRVYQTSSVLNLRWWWRTCVPLYSSHYCRLPRPSLLECRFSRARFVSWFRGGTLSPGVSPRAEELLSLQNAAARGPRHPV